MGRTFEDVTRKEDLPREGFILSGNKLYEVDGNFIRRSFEMSEYIDENMSTLLDTSGCLGGIPACCVPADAVIYVDRFNLFDEYLYSYPTYMFKSKKFCDYDAIPYPEIIPLY